LRTLAASLSGIFFSFILGSDIRWIYSKKHETSWISLYRAMPEEEDILRNKGETRGAELVEEPLYFAND